jgi:hypothetical protein
MFRLSDYYGEGWQTIQNSRGLSPSIDFAHTSKFKINKCFQKNIQHLFEKYKHTAIMGERSLTIRNIPEINNYIRYVSAITYNINMKVAELGVKFKLHPMLSEAYMYNMTPDMNIQKNIDNWHYDYMPFVFVYMVKKNSNSNSGGRLILNINGNKKCISLEEGEGIFMQGSQIEHIAERCEGGDRVTLVLSFIPEDITIRDNTYVTKDMSPYHPNESLHAQYLKYKNERILQLKKEKEKLMIAIENEWADIGRSFKTPVISKL